MAFRFAGASPSFFVTCTAHAYLPLLTTRQVYVKSRLCMPPPPCPGGVSLLQERYTEDAWHLLIACNLMSRVSSGPVKVRGLID